MESHKSITQYTKNGYFTWYFPLLIGSDLTKTFTDAVKLHWSLPESNHRFKFQQISEDEVLNNFNKLLHKSKQDVLGYDSRLLGDASDSLASSITSLFNMSLHTHHLPADWKKARVTPIYKGTGEVNEPNNYRPISIVSHISKMFEKCINHQLLQYFESHPFLRHDQSAFRKGHSTGAALHKFVDDLLDIINERMMNAICFFDLKKFFDTINHYLLWSKLQKYGVEDKELLWFTDYLYDRSQAVNVDGCISSFSNINTGVPQGSVLGPLLFLIFIIDLPTCLGNTLMNIYADDTAIHVCGTDFKNIQKRLQEEVDKVVQWFHSNRLVINNLKCYCMIISSHTNQHTLIIYIDDVKIHRLILRNT